MGLFFLVSGNPSRYEQFSASLRNASFSGAQQQMTHSLAECASLMLLTRTFGLDRLADSLPIVSLNSDQSHFSGFFASKILTAMAQWYCCNLSN